MVIVCAASDANAIESHLRRDGAACYRIGDVRTGNREVLI